jgi:hypothetical protein
MEEERKQKLQAKTEANKPKKVTLPKLKFLDQRIAHSPHSPSRDGERIWAAFTPRAAAR